MVLKFGVERSLRGTAVLTTSMPHMPKHLRTGAAPRPPARPRPGLAAGLRPGGAARPVPGLDGPAHAGDIAPVCGVEVVTGGNVRAAGCRSGRTYVSRV